MAEQSTSECDNTTFFQDVLAYMEANEQLHKSVEELLAWRKVRPFLFDGQCQYSRGLLQTILDSYLVCCKFKGDEPDKVLVVLLRKLMRSGPPPRTPPSAKGRPPRRPLLFNRISVTLLGPQYHNASRWLRDRRLWAIIF